MKTMQTVALIGAMEPEIELLKNALQDLKEHQFGALTMYSGMYADKRVILSLSGIGKVNAAVATALLIAHFHPDCVINTGSAGGIGDGLKVGDVVIGVQTAHHDVDVTAFGYVAGQVPQMPARFDGDEHLIAAAQRAAAAFEQAKVHKGLIVSGDQFINSDEKLQHIRGLFADVLAVEMEAAAIAQSCARLQVPFVVIRAISDAANDEASVSFDAFLQTAGKHSAQMVLDLLTAL